MSECGGSESRITRSVLSAQAAVRRASLGAAFVFDVAAIVKMFPKDMGRRLQQRGSKKKTTVFKSLVNSTRSPSVDYLANHARFVARNPRVPVPHGTTANEAFHLQLKRAFGGKYSLTKEFVHRHLRYLLMRKMVADSFRRESWNPADTTEDEVVQAFGRELLRTGVVFEPRLEMTGHCPRAAA